ncbi:MAG: hypothetical protein K2I52_08385, partial [Muribaculaceae bacterium]|nr:hypothetical protein [Muribaculaceae bacterium]
EGTRAAVAMTAMTRHIMMWNICFMIRKQWKVDMTKVKKNIPPQSGLTFFEYIWHYSQLMGD